MHGLNNISELPDISDIHLLSQGMAALDCILAPEWAYRYFSFNAQWSIADAEQMASMRDGQGDEYFILFNAFGVIGKVYSNECEVAKAGVFKDVPKGFSSFMNEPAFSIKDSSFIFWREAGNREWAVRPEIPSYSLLKFFDKSGVHYKQWADEYYGINLDIDDVRSVILKQDFSDDVIKRLNPEADIGAVREELTEIYGPVSGLLPRS